MHIFVSIFLIILISFISFPCFAQGPQDSAQSFQCPNKLECKQRLYNNYSSSSSEQTIGTIDVKCCYTFPTGCRPWHCDGDKTDNVYWQAKCDETFPVCRDNHAGYTDPFCTAHFKSYF